jgi:putative oxidoreductase
LISRFNEEEDVKVPALVAKPYGLATAGLDFVAPLFDLALRLYVAWVFFRSGLVKIQSWDATLYLFENEYEVPFLPPELAAYLGTAAELTLPFFLALGLGTRLFALVLFAFNAVAVISYPELSPAGLKDHLLWGALLLVTLFHGPGRLSLDAWLCSRIRR